MIEDIHKECKHGVMSLDYCSACEQTNTELDKAVCETAKRCIEIVEQRILSANPVGSIKQKIKSEFGV